jgi:hypothetical protein
VTGKLSRWLASDSSPFIHRYDSAGAARRSGGYCTYIRRVLHVYPALVARFDPLVLLVGAGRDTLRYPPRLAIDTGDVLNDLESATSPT